MWANRAEAKQNQKCSDWANDPKLSRWLPGPGSVCAIWASPELSRWSEGHLQARGAFLFQKPGVCHPGGHTDVQYHHTTGSLLGDELNRTPVFGVFIFDDCPSSEPDELIVWRDSERELLNSWVSNSKQSSDFLNLDPETLELGGVLLYLFWCPAIAESLLIPLVFGPLFHWVSGMWQTPLRQRTYWKEIKYIKR